MKSIAKKILNRLGFEVRRAETWPYVQLPASQQPARGTVLLAFRPDPFLLPVGEELSTGHTNLLESFQIAEALLGMGYAVDVIDYRDSRFIPKKDYQILISSRVCISRLARLVGPRCVKIFYATVSHWLWNNTAAYIRNREVLERRGVALGSFKIEAVRNTIECADFGIILSSNDFAFSSYLHAQKPLARVPLCTHKTFDWPEGKSFDAVRKRFIWLGSHGFVHKGLDLVLEAFAAMPDYHLTVCGPIHEEPDFERAFAQELYRTKNIETLGWMDISSQAFVDLAAEHVGLVYPSCAEGTSGGVLTCMQAGLIPLVTYESGIDISDGKGVMIEALTIEAVRAAVEQTATMPEEELHAMAIRAWQSAHENHTRERFSEEFRKAVEAALAYHVPGKIICSRSPDA